MSIATVVSITGQAWARDAEGNLRELQQGDQLLDGETLVTSDNGAVELDFADGLPPVAIGGGQQVAMNDELNADEPVDPNEASAQGEGIGALLAALDGDGDLLEDLEATAAGAGGGALGGGHSFIQLARIVESIDPLAFAFDTARGNGVFNEGRSPRQFAFEDTDASTATPDTSAEITVSLTDATSANVANTPISGTTSDVEAGQLVTLVISDDDATTADVTVSAAVEADGRYTTTADLSSLNDGSLSVTATVSDQAGNRAVSSDTATLDTRAEAGTVTVNAITSDDVINAAEADQTITVTGTATGGDIAAGDSVAMTINGTAYTTSLGENGAWRVDVEGSDLAADTAFDVAVSSSDAAGNPVITTGSSEHGVDTTAPGAGSGENNTIAFDDANGLINDAEKGSVTFTGTVETAGTIDSIVITDGQGGSVIVDAADITVDGTTVSVAGQDLSGLADGELTVTMTVTDQAGNQGSVDDNAVLDTTAPGAGDGTNHTIAFDDANGLINDAEKGAVTFTGTVETAGTIDSIVITDGQGGSVIVDAADITVDGTTVSVAGQDLSGLADGELTVTMTVTDQAGNQGSVDDNAVLDTTAPGAGDGTNHTIAFDDANGLINDAEKGAVTFTGTVETAGTIDSIVITDGQGGSVIVDAADITVDGTTVSVAGQDLSGLADGELTVTMTVTDQAGNQGSVDDNAVLDTTIGDGDANTGAAVTIDGITDDTGTASDDFITSDTTLVLNGSVELEDGDSLTVSFNGSDYTSADTELQINADGTWTLDVTDTELTDGTYTVNAVVSDAAGNSATASQDVVVDTTIGDGDTNTGAAVTIDGITDDTGTASDDFITNDTTLVLNGSVELEDGDSLTVSFNGSDYTTANGLNVDATAGTWTLDVTDTELTDGTYTVNAVVSDVAGNEATASQNVVVDTTIGDGDTNTGAAVTIDGISDDTGTASDDFITHDTTLMLNGSVELEDGDSLTVSFNGSDYTSADTELQINADGTWTLDLTATELAEGTYTVSAVVSDVAGNSATASQNVLVDTTIGDGDANTGAAVTIDGITDDTGTASDDFITNDTTLVL
ncbi:retention module-containing protein, partial [Onishia taeanensis]